MNSDLTPGEIDLNNCKILYEKLLFLSESQASDERLYGLTHSTFYDYMRKRWGYGYGKPKSAEKKQVLSRLDFFTDIQEEVDYIGIRYQNAGGRS